MHPKRTVYSKKRSRSRQRNTRKKHPNAFSRPFWYSLQSFIRAQWWWWQTLYWQERTSQQRRRATRTRQQYSRQQYSSVTRPVHSRSRSNPYRWLGFSRAVVQRLTQGMVQAIAQTITQATNQANRRIPGSTARQTTDQANQSGYLNQSVTTGLISMLALGSSFLITWQLKARANYVEPQQPVFQESAIDVLHLPPLGIFWMSAAEIEQKSGELFASPNSVGAIALGAAEGTRTGDGGKTLIWHRHTDPGNGAENKGTFAWQLGAATPDEADLKGLARIRYEAIPYLIRQAEQEVVIFDIITLIHGADLWNQSPDAGADFVKNLSRCLRRDLQDEDAIILCARIESFYNPETAELEASGFNSDPQRLEQDQIRRMQAIQQVLQQNQEKVAVSFQPPS